MFDMVLTVILVLCYLEDLPATALPRQNSEAATAGAL